MSKFRFEIQSCIKVTVEANSSDEARSKVIGNLDDYAFRLIHDCYVSDGIEIKDVEG